MVDCGPVSTDVHVCCGALFSGSSLNYQNCEHLRRRFLDTGTAREDEMPTGQALIDRYCNPRLIG